MVRINSTQARQACARQHQQPLRCNHVSILYREQLTEQLSVLRIPDVRSIALITDSTVRSSAAGAKTSIMLLPDEQRLKLRRHYRHATSSFYCANEWALVLLTYYLGAIVTANMLLRYHMP